MVLKREFHPSPVPDSIKKVPAWLAFRTLQTKAFSAELALVTPDTVKLSKRYKKQQLPIVPLAGREEGRAHKSKHAARFHAEVPHVDYRIVEGAGHMVYHIAPEEVMDAIHTADARPSVPSFSQNQQRLGWPAIH